MVAVCMHYKDSATQTDPDGDSESGKTWTDDNGHPALGMARKKEEQARAAFRQPSPEPDNMSPTLANLEGHDRNMDSNHGGASSHSLSVGGSNAEASEKAERVGTRVVRGRSTTPRDHGADSGELLLASTKELVGTEHHVTIGKNEAADEDEHAYLSTSEDHSAAGASSKLPAVESREHSPGPGNDQEPGDEQGSSTREIKTREVEEGSDVKCHEDKERTTGRKKKKNKNKNKKKKKPKSEEQQTEEATEETELLSKEEAKMETLLDAEAKCLISLRQAFTSLIATQGEVPNAAPGEWRDVFQDGNENSKRYKWTLRESYTRFSNLLYVLQHHQTVSNPGSPRAQMDVIRNIEAHLRKNEWLLHEKMMRETWTSRMLGDDGALPGRLATEAYNVHVQTQSWAWSKLLLHLHHFQYPQMPGAPSFNFWLSNSAVNRMWSQAMAFKLKEGWQLTGS